MAANEGSKIWQLKKWWRTISPDRRRGLLFMEPVAGSFIEITADDIIYIYIQYRQEPSEEGSIVSCYGWEVWDPNSLRDSPKVSASKGLIRGSAPDLFDPEYHDLSILPPYLTSNELEHSSRMPSWLTMPTWAHPDCIPSNTLQTPWRA